MGKDDVRIIQEFPSHTTTLKCGLFDKFGRLCNQEFPSHEALAKHQVEVHWEGYQAPERPERTHTIPLTESEAILLRGLLKGERKRRPELEPLFQQIEKIIYG